jgi:hypothetical protein
LFIRETALVVEKLEFGLRCWRVRRVRAVGRPRGRRKWGIGVGILNSHTSKAGSCAVELMWVVVGCCIATFKTVKLVWRVFFPEREIFISRDSVIFFQGSSGISVELHSTRAGGTCSSVTFCPKKKYSLIYLVALTSGVGVSDLGMEVS